MRCIDPSSTSSNFVARSKLDIKAVAKQLFQNCVTYAPPSPTLYTHSLLHVQYNLVFRKRHCSLIYRKFELGNSIFLALTFTNERKVFIIIYSTFVCVT